MEQIIPPVDKELLKAELTPDKRLRMTNKSHNQIYVVDIHDSPNVVREIGRQREEVFREAGGGTGKALDLDEFDLMDNCYKQLLVWNPDEEEIIGYRDVLNTIHESYEYIPLTANHILQLHRDLYKYSEKSIGGSFKNTQNYISATDTDGKSYVLFTPLAPFETPEAIDRICESYNRIIDTQEVDPLILIPTFIHDFLCILRMPVQTQGQGLQALQEDPGIEGRDGRPCIP